MSVAISIYPPQLTHALKNKQHGCADNEQRSRSLAAVATVNYRGGVCRSRGVRAAKGEKKRQEQEHWAPGGKPHCSRDPHRPIEKSSQQAVKAKEQDHKSNATEQKCRRGAISVDRTCSVRALDCSRPVPVGCEKHQSNHRSFAFRVHHVWCCLTGRSFRPAKLAGWMPGEGGAGASNLTAKQVRKTSQVRKFTHCRSK